MKRLGILVMLISAITIASAQTSEADKIEGYWLNAEKDGKIQIYRVGNKYFGKLVWVKQVYEKDGITLRTDTKNPDEKLRNRGFINLVLLTDFTYDDGQWSGGRIYDPKSGRTYRSTMNLENGELKIRGYVGFSMFGRTTIWQRAN